MPLSLRWPLTALAILIATLSPSAYAVVGELDLTRTGVGYFAVILFILAYLLVM